MNRTWIVGTIMLLLVLGVEAQNIQLHYDFGRSLYDKELDIRPRMTSTIEMFKPDKCGSTYFFVDMDYTSKGVAMTYGEISRELSFWGAPFSVHIEYKGTGV